jgi:Fe-S oxidoreductase
VTGLPRAAELCLSCPKLCSFACPVSEVAGRETLTPWGKVSLAELTCRPSHAPDASAAAAFAACTGCLRCQQHCAHANDVPDILNAARAHAVRAGVAPAAYAAVATRMAQRGHAEEGDLAAVHAALASAQPPRGAGDALLPLLLAGCDALAQGGEEARLALLVARALGAPLRLGPAGALCCGLKLAQAGHPELYAAHAARLRDALAAAATPEGARRAAPLQLVFLSPACARATAAHLPEDARVEHVTSYLARALAARPELLDRPRLPGPVVFHDPCGLSRGLVEVTAPRALLAAAVEDVREPARSAVETSCCGADGLLAQALPEVSAAMARARAAELAACGAPAVTASPACAAQLGAGSLLALLARFLAVTDAGGPALT